MGAGIVGLAHAAAAIRRGLRVAIVERDVRPSQASIRNFGFVTVSGQAAGLSRERALRTRKIWMEVAAAAGIPILQRGAVVVARREEALAVLEEFAGGAMGEGCALWDAGRARHEIPALASSVAGALWSPHELRVEAREALPLLATWLESRGVAFTWGAAALHMDAHSLRHSNGALEAECFVFAPGSDVATLFPEVARRVGLRLCKLQMMRLAPQAGAWRLPGVALSDLSLVRYEGFASQPSAAALRARLERECPVELECGVHLIVAQGADGSLVVGDSHAYGDAADPFASARVEALILDELRALLRLSLEQVWERWVGFYPVSQVGPVVSEPIGANAQLVVVTSGTGMSTAFAIGEETIDALFGSAR